MAVTDKHLEKLRNIGISAHIDSGKTTLTERILYYTGRIHKIEEVRGKSGVGAKMDSMELERERGITIQSAATYCQWRTSDKSDYNINIIDTPGHVDFTIEVERALGVLDGAILVLCAVGGVQSQSLTVDRQMRRYNVPRLAFVNKMDRMGADVFGVAQQLQDKLRHKPCVMQVPIGTGADFDGVIDLVELQALYFDGDNGEIIRREKIPAALEELVEEHRANLIEVLADFDDELAELYLGGEVIPSELIHTVVRRATLSLDITPVFCGTAYRNKGVQPLVDAACKYLPNPSEGVNHAFDETGHEEVEVELEADSSKPLCAMAFKLEDGKYGQLTYTRIYQGHLAVGDWIWNSRTGRKVKLGRLVKMHSDELHEIKTAGAGEIVAIFGIECASGDTFHGQKVAYSKASIYVPEPVISYAIWAEKKKDMGNFSKALNRFSREDPTFRVRKDEESGQTLISGMGELHLDVYVERMKREYNCTVGKGEPQVAYREAISQEIEFDCIHKKQTGGSGQYARICGFFRPYADGDFSFIDKIVGGSIPREYIPSCETGFKNIMAKGSLIGFPIVGIEVEINDGNSHAVDSSDLAFQTCARKAFRENYARMKPTILEPIMKVSAETPVEYQGTVLATLNRRRGQIVGTEVKQGVSNIEAEVPLSCMFGYSTDLRSATQGKAEFTMEFSRYAPAPKSVIEELIEEYSKKNKR